MLFEKGMKVCVCKIVAQRVYFIQLDPSQHILGKTNIYNKWNLEWNILQMREYPPQNIMGFEVYFAWRYILIAH